MKLAYPKPKPPLNLHGPGFEKRQALEVYKVDGFARSLADFAKMVEVFDSRYGVDHERRTLQAELSIFFPRLLFGSLNGSAPGVRRRHRDDVVIRPV